MCHRTFVIIEGGAVARVHSTPICQGGREGEQSVKQGAQPHLKLWSGMRGEAKGQTSGRRRWLWTSLLALLLLSTVLSACGADASQQQAQQNKAKLDQELVHARKDLGIPDSLLQPVVTQEQKVSSGEGGLFYNYSDAAANYALLYNQLIGIEQSSGDLLKKQTQADLDAFTQILAKRRADGFIEADQYQARLDQALQDFDQVAHVAGYPGPPNAAAGEAEANWIVPLMVGMAVQNGDVNGAVDWATQKLEAIYAKSR